MSDYHHQCGFPHALSFQINVTGFKDGVKQERYGMCSVKAVQRCKVKCIPNIYLLSCLSCLSCRGPTNSIRGSELVRVCRMSASCVLFGCSAYGSRSAFSEVLTHTLPTLQAHVADRRNTPSTPVRGLCCGPTSKPRYLEYRV